jgi:DNA-binding GntR family transcriptional regulator
VDLVMLYHCVLTGNARMLEHDIANWEPAKQYVVRLRNIQEVDHHSVLHEDSRINRTTFPHYTELNCSAPQSPTRHSIHSVM